MNSFYTPDELEAELGEQLRAERLRQNLTMHDVALRAGISEQTIRSLENGSGGRLNSFIRLMKALGKEEWLGTFRPAVRISPMDIVKRAGKRRLRATRSVL
ncbi:helix-turn-helix domain-containing protein [Comamonas suwonensis]|uniref:Helix-turn-helix domain-containing protein n=1 Tax=Comamonas suwonensis TaxID=2606214 RepID=A0A843B532_9BURK|nr:helix-turn-helix domain-containing protein [Comamonas suwonensis]MBI1625891.1 helix-turn-helix domain-containing protein [Comamonas suwonensis]